MEETVNEPDLFEETLVADVQTEDKSSPAVEESKEQPTSENNAVESTDDSKQATESKIGDEIDEFLAKKGVKSDDPEALRKVAEMYRNVEKQFYANSQEKAKLERQIAQSANLEPSDQTPMERLRVIEEKLEADRQIQAVKEWKAQKSITPEVEAKMVEYLSQPIVSRGVAQTDPQGRPLTRMFLVSQGIMSYDDIYKAVGGESIKSEELKTELKNAVEAELVAKRNAKTTTPLSTNSTAFSKKDEYDEFEKILMTD